jgi:hypothetical protein
MDDWRSPIFYDAISAAFGYFRFLCIHRQSGRSFNINDVYAKTFNCIANSAK